MVYQSMNVINLIWISGNYLSENSPRSDAGSVYFHCSKSTLICCGCGLKFSPAMLVSLELFMATLKNCLLARSLRYRKIKNAYM